MVARGGLDNRCSVHILDDDDKTSLDEDPRTVELGEHDGYVSSCRFQNSERILSASGDAGMKLWNIERTTLEREFAGHSGDIMGVEFHPTDENLFISGSCDTSAKWWDQRQEHAAFTFHDQEADVNAVSFFSNGHTIATGSDDASAMMFDIRCGQMVNQLQRDNIVSGVTSVATSSSGRLLIAGYDDYSFRIWDTLRHVDSPGSAKPFAPTKDGHLDRVSCVGVESGGKAIATGSWDELIKVWCS